LSWIVVQILGGAVSWRGQLFFGYRLKVLSGYWFPAIFIGLLSSGSYAAALVSGVQTYRLGGLNHSVDRSLLISTAIWTGSTALCDVIIVVATTYLLLREKADNKATRLIVSRIIRLLMETGLLTATAAIAHMILFLAFNKYDYYAITGFSMAKLYSNSMLVVLNSRMRIENGRENYSKVDVAASGLGNSNRLVFNHTTQTIDTPREVRLDVRRDSQDDDLEANDKAQVIKY